MMSGLSGYQLVWFSPFRCHCVQSTLLGPQESIFISNNREYFIAAETQMIIYMYIDEVRKDFIAAETKPRWLVRYILR